MSDTRGTNQGDQSGLERRYRRWLACYPQSFRDEHAEEMITVLLDGSEPGQSRPRAREATDLAVRGMSRRAGTGLPGNWERAHAKIMVPLRIAIALWLCVISAVLIHLHRGEGWLFVLLPAIVLHLVLAGRNRSTAVRR